jgi:hypothetical protein
MVTATARPIGRSPTWWWTAPARLMCVWISWLRSRTLIWLDHCHHLKHAEQGMVAHLMYQGVTTPYRIGGTADNRPE